MASVSVENVSKTYPNGVVALSNVSFTSADNELLVIVGPSGCGKSTLLHIISGLEPQTCGNILIDGINVSNQLPHLRNVSMVFQNYALLPHMTVYDNIAFPLKIKKWKNPNIEKKVKEIAQRMVLSDYLDRKPDTLSGGQRQRVAIGRAMVLEPKIFLLDEPLSDLDAALREKTRKELVMLHRSTNSVFILVTHDQTEAMSMGDRLVVMDRGIVQQIDTPKSIYERPANRFVAGFVGTPKMNFISHTLFCVLCEEPVDSSYEEYEIGIRPENIHIGAQRAEKAFGVVSSVEILGKDAYFHLTFSDERVTVCCASTLLRHGYAVGERIPCQASLNHFLFFDKITGVRVDVMK